MDDRPRAPTFLADRYLLPIELLSGLVPGTIDGIEYPALASSTPTAMVRLQSGARLVVQEYPNAYIAETVRSVSLALERGGVPVPSILVQARSGSREFVVSGFVEGTAGQALVDGPSGLALAAKMGELARRVRFVQAHEIAVDSAWERPQTLREASVLWAGYLSDEAQRRLLVSCAQEIGRHAWAPVVTHGDFAPINVLVAEGRIAALVDLRSVARRHPLVDVAWWELIVRYHHAETYKRLSLAFTQAAGVSDERELRLLPAMAILRTAELLAQSSSVPMQAHLRALLGSALEWAAESEQRQMRL